MPTPDPRDGVPSEVSCPRCRRPLWRVPLGSSGHTSGRTSSLVCPDRVHCLYSETDEQPVYQAQEG